MNSDVTTQIRCMVSKKKKRYQKQGFDLDLCYVTDRIIAMGFPADNFEALYRNYIVDVAKFFELNHSGQYKIYNLCRERNFDSSKFSGEICKYPFDDHNPPSFPTLISCIEDIGRFLSGHPKNVVAVNCKAGKGRTGVIVCCSLLYSGVSSDAASALTEYGQSRTYNGKGVTIPSQIRYIFYYDHLLRNNLTYKPIALWLRLVKFEVIPNISNAELQFGIYQSDLVSKVHTSRTYKISKDNRVVIFDEILTFPLSEDLRFEFIQRPLVGGSMVICHCWLNTYFVVHQPSIQTYEFVSKYTNSKPTPRYHRIHTETCRNEMNINAAREKIYKVSLTKHEIDGANKDVSCRIFPHDFKIIFLFSDTPPKTASMPRDVNLISTFGNSSFFQSLPDFRLDSLNPRLETLWKSASSQFYFDCD